MKEMDTKEKLILFHYKKLIENREFDEYDVLGFLIFIRRHIDEYKNLLEFADLVAHRERNKGTVLHCIESAKRNDYKLVENSKAVEGYNGIPSENLIIELRQICKELDIYIDDEAIAEICFCIFSLAQFSCYQLSDKKGEVVLVQDKNNALALCTNEGTNDSPYVCFSILQGVVHYKTYSAGIIDCPVEAVRDMGKIKLWDGYEYVSGYEIGN